MNTRTVQEVFIGDGTAFDANNTNIAAIANQMDIVGSDMTCLDPAGVDTVITQPTIFITNKLANGDIKRSFPIGGMNLAGLSCSRYKPAAREVWGVGYNRGFRTEQNTTGTYTAAAGSITVNNSTQYDLSIRFKWDKMFYSERPEILRVSFTSAAAATQLTIATQITDAINNSAFGNQVSGIKCIKAVTVGDGTGIYGLTAATNYGVEIWGLDVNQFSNTQYAFRQVRFSVHVLDASGFESTACVNMQKAYAGNGTYAQIYNAENFAYQFEGVLNRTKFPIPSLAYLSSSTLALSGKVAACATTPTGNIATVIGEDVATVVTATSGLRPGEIVTIDAVEYEVKYIISGTKFVMTAVSAATYGAGDEFKVKYGYATINLLVNDVTATTGANIGQLSQKSILIATPNIDAAAADPFDYTNTLDSASGSAELLDLRDVINTWAATTALNPPVITVATLA